MSKKSSNQDENLLKETPTDNTNLFCGIIMPLSDTPNCSSSHWIDIQSIIKECAEKAGFTAKMVSENDEVGVIHKRIIQNIYDAPIAVCDISELNPNVMFELGMRLTFDKATIIIKDDKSKSPFDTSSIEYLQYPRDLRYNQIIAFKETLTEKISKTYQKSINDPNYSTFIKSFGQFTVPKLEQTTISLDQYILNQLEILNSKINKLQRNSNDILINKCVDKIKMDSLTEFNKNFYVNIKDKSSGFINHFLNSLQQIQENDKSLQINYDSNMDEIKITIHRNSIYLHRLLELVDLANKAAEKNKK